MEQNKNFDIDSIIEQITSKLEDALGDILADQVESAVTCAVQDVFEEALHTSLSRFEFELADGTVVRPTQVAKIISPDKTKMLPCYGGFRVDGSTLIVQTSTTCWESIAVYKSKEEATDALKKVIETIKYDEQMRPDIRSYIEL